jgi:nitrile hydratase accessory protein
MTSSYSVTDDGDPTVMPSGLRLADDADGVTTPLPRRNGELVFEEPWESRAFGTALALAEGGTYEWATFRQSLIHEIGSWEQRYAGLRSWRYYERWLAALESLLLERGIVSAEELNARIQVEAETAAHEHDHEH